MRSLVKFLLIIGTCTGLEARPGDKWDRTTVPADKMRPTNWEVGIDTDHSIARVQRDRNGNRIDQTV